MSIKSTYSWLSGFLALGVCLAALPVEASRPFEEEERSRRALFLRPAMESPEAQLAYAQQLRENGRLRRAQRQFRALVRTWPRTDEAAIAQKQFAQVLSERGRHRRALEEFERLETEYPGRYPHALVLDELFELANALRTERRGQWLFLPGYTRPERAVPFFERIVKTGPRWERVAEAKLALAELQEEIGEPEMAILIYERLERRHPGRDEAITAAFRRAHLLNEISERYPRHVDGMEIAYIALGLAVQRYPRDERADQARLEMQRLQSRMAQAAYEKATFYDIRMRNPQAAIITYERFLANFPTAEQVPQVRYRLAALQAKMENSDG